MNPSVAGKSWERFLWPILTGALFLAFWQFAVVWSATKVVPPPSQVLHGMLDLARKHVLGQDILDSLRRVLSGYLIAVVVGLPAGLLLGRFRAVYQTINPVLQILRPISPLAWIPVAVLLFGIGNTSAIFLVFLASFFPITVACGVGVATVPLAYRQIASNFGLSPATALWRVIFPAALPEILIGLRLALGVAWLVVVAAEMIAVDSGLGYRIIDSRNSGKHYDLVIGVMIVIGLIGLALDLLFRGSEKFKSVRWGFRQ